jgi:2-dehydro-3-deoxyphosphogluconate aldolase / (4S)-4-hydroxy-2-oxoglutarate aldolase
LLRSLHHQPLLLVLRPRQPIQAAPLLECFVALGLRHVEIAWHGQPHWAEQSRELIASFPSLALGAASVRSVEAVGAVAAAGYGYAVSPILEPALLHHARAEGIELIPGVMSPSEVHQARSMGCPIVKLFPAAPLGMGYWRLLRAPLGEPMPFCIAAGGLGPADVLPWLAAGVDAVALGSSLTARDGTFDPEPLQLLLASLPRTEA